MEGRDVLEAGAGLKGGGWGVWLGPPSSLGPPMVPARGGPKVFKLNSSWRQRGRSRNSIAFGSAPRREADRSDRNTQVGFFVSGRLGSKKLGGQLFLRVSSGRMVMQPTAEFLVGGSNPGRANMAAALAMTVDGQGFETPTQKYHSTRVCCDSNMPPHCLEPSDHELLTPPHPPLKK